MMLTLLVLFLCGFAAPLAAQVPAPWTAQDLGAPTLVGSATMIGGTWTVTGAGTDIWGTADQGQFVSQPLSGDGSITAQVTSQQAVTPYSKAGVMFREDTTTGSRYVALVLTPGPGAEFQWRMTAGGVSFVQVTPATVPVWIRLTRAGNVFTGAISANGTTWTTFVTTTVPMATSALAGLAVTSQNPTARSTATFANVSVAGPPILVSALATWQANPEPDIAGYTLSYGTTSGLYTTSLPLVNMLTDTVPGLVAGTTYYFALTATNIAGLTSPPSAEVVYVAPLLVLSNVRIVG